MERIAKALEERILGLLSKDTLDEVSSGKISTLVKTLIDVRREMLCGCSNAKPKKSL